MSVAELSELIPPEILKYALIEPDMESNKDINPTGDKLILALQRHRKDKHAQGA